MLYVKKKRRIFVECGRKFGKSDFATDTCWRLGNMIRNGQGYYFGAWQKSVREFMWKNKRLQHWGPREYIAEVNETDMRVTYTSGTFVKLEGADNYAAIKGFNPDFVILDEFADYPDEFWHAMSPNFASKDCIVIIISSPPWLLESSPGEPVLFCRIADLWKRRMLEADKAGKWSKFGYINMPSHVNEMNLPPGFLENERQELFAMGLEDIWQREYLAQRVVGGGKRLVGTFSRREHVKPHQWIMDRIEKDAHHMTWVTGLDPGSSSVFGGLVAAINEYTKEVYWLDELYETRENETMVEFLWPRVQEKEDELFPGEDPERFLRVYDEAAKWFYVEAMNRFNVNFLPTEKALNSIEFGLSLLRTIFRFNLGYVSDRCTHFVHELENWRKDKNGNIPKTGKHLIDCSRYQLHVANYVITPEDMPEKPKVHAAYAPRYRSMDQDMAEEEGHTSLFRTALDDLSEDLEDSEWN